MKKKPVITEPLRKALSDSGKTQLQIAADTGVSQSVISRIMSGDRQSLSLDAAETLATYLSLELKRK